MSTPLDRAVIKIKSLTVDQQDIAASLLEDFALNQSEAPYVLSTEEERLIDEGLSELERGEHVPHGEIKDLLAKYRK